MKPQNLLFRLLQMKFAPAPSVVSLGLLFGSTILFGSPWILSSTAKAVAQQDEVFTESQAARGQAVYDKRCASCHGLRLEGGSASALSGGKFADKWGHGDKTVDDLYYITRTQMPFGAGNTLSRQQYIDVVAYMLKANGYKPGARELAANPALLKQIKIVTKGSLKEGFIQTQAENAPNSSATPAPANGAPDPTSKGPTQQELNAAPSNAADWLMSNHDYTGQRYVDLKQINRLNAASLRPACIYQAGDTKAFHSNPVVYRGVMYITTTYSTIALDATNCRVRWRHDWKRKSVEIYPPNRGAAIKDGRVVRATTDGYLFALDIETGKLLWERKVIATEKIEGSFNMAPVVFENLVLLGLGISEQGVKGWIGAFRLETGEPVWRFNTVPDDGEPGAETWGDPKVRKRGGGAVWAPLSLDPQAGLVYVPVANPAPDFLADVRPGANLYTNSLVVLDARTGKLKWHYQATPSDTHDWDLTQVSPLFTAAVGGKTRKLVALASKDGLLRVLDRETKEKLYETPVTTRTNVDVPLTTQGVYACPGVLGGVLWNGPAYNPNTNMLYTPAVDWCGKFIKAREDRFIPGQLYMGGMYIDDPIGKARGWLTAVDASTGKVAWRYESSKPMLAAVATTSADLIFTGEMTGDFLTLDARTGKVLYRFNTGGPMNAGVVTYAINGKQYVAAASGSASGFWRVAPGSSTVVIFSLPEPNRLRAGK
ncbi:MAG: PQQ-binding-like beta-propeller repeat protein [Blastocatellia bacterium]